MCGIESVFSGPGLHRPIDISRQRTCTHSRAPPLLEYFPKKPANYPDSPGFRILQDSMASSGVRPRSFSYAGETVPLRRQDSMGQYGRLIFEIMDGSRFTENSASRWPIRPFSRICRQCMTEQGRGREMRFCQGGPRPTPLPVRKKFRINPTPSGGGRPATPLRPRAGIPMPAGGLPVSGYRAVAGGEGGWR